MPRWFSESEIVGLDPQLVKMLDAARGFAKTPFIITSGLRSASENTAAGGVENSAHMRGLGVDLACTGSRARFRIVTGLLIAGCTRIGCYDRHVHADVDDSLPQNVIWTGKSS